MIRMKLPENITNSGLAMPESTPKTLIEINGESLPYACQCPLCGGLFDIPEGLLYKVEEDTLKDGDFDAEATGSGDDIDIDAGESSVDAGGSSEPTQSSAASDVMGVGETSDTAI
jgi:hypothetical protein